MTIEQTPDGKSALVFDNSEDLLNVLQDLEGLHADNADRYRQLGEAALAEYEDSEASHYYTLRHEVI